jgi:hypothetical protein
MARRSERRREDGARVERWQGVPWFGKELSPPPLSESGRAAALAMGSLVFPQAGSLFLLHHHLPRHLILDFQTRRAEQLLWYGMACALWCG